MPRLVLASASPARLATLRAAGVEPEVMVSGVDESVPDGTTTADAVLLLARRKAEEVAARVVRQQDALVLGCDSLLDLDGRTLGKPRDAADADARWRSMRGRAGVLHTGHWLVGAVGATGAVASTTVRFADVDDAEIAAYVATGEPLAVAGAFTIDGLGGAFVDGIDGDPHTVVGVSLPLLRRLLGGLGIRWTDLWAPARTSTDDDLRWVT